jgi:hypothetical protein
MAKPKSEPVKQLLFSRKQAAEVLGRVDVSYIRRLEKTGVLRPVRLIRSPSAMVFFTAENIAAVAAGSADET